MPKLLDELMQANLQFVQEARWKTYPDIEGTPARKVAVYTCMDCRLINFLFPALGFGRGDVKVIRTAGNTILDNVNDSVIISLAVAIYKLGVEEILVVGHYDCGMSKINMAELIQSMQERGIEESTIQKIRPNLEAWFGGLSCLLANIQTTCAQIRNSPLIPNGIPVHGLLIHPLTGMMQILVDGYKNTEQQN